MFAGIDLHKKFSYVTLMNDKGEIFRQEKISTNIEETKKFFQSVNDGKLKAVIEPTGQWYLFYELLEKLGCEVHLAHPLKVKAIASARIKTDKIDSTVLAHLLRTNLLPEAYIPSREMRDLKELVRLRASLVWLRTRAKNKIHAVLLKNGIELPYTDIFCQRGKNCLSSLRLRSPYQEALVHYLKLIKVLDSQVEETEKEIQKQVKDHPKALLLTSIPYISYFSALLIVTEIGQIKRFPDWRHLCSYAGVVPSVYASGNKRYTGRITKQGSRWLRWIIIEAAQKQGQRNTKLGRFYQKIARRKGKSTAKVATARMLLRAIYYMLKRNEPYREYPVRKGHSSETYSPSIR